jgi:hypothetical protein
MIEYRRVNLLKKELVSGNKRVVKVVCDSCGYEDYEKISDGVIGGTLRRCKNCGKLLFFPVPGGHMDDDPALQKDLRDLVESCIVRE